MDTERRAATRKAARDHVGFETGGLTHSGAMRNLSELGCMIESPDLDALVGQRITVSLPPDYSLSGRIAWLLGDAVGISFDQAAPLHIVREFALDGWSLRALDARLTTSKLPLPSQYFKI